jgi:RNA polymerase sigma-70 factor (ECF subfamily)
MNPEERKQLVRKAKAGDVDAFAAVFEDYRSVVFAVAYRMVGANDADDVVMETYLKAWKAVPRFNEKSSIKTWLYRITSNCALDWLRKRKRSRETVLREDDGDSRTIEDLADDGQAAPYTEQVKREDYSQLNNAVDKLDEPHRVVLLLRFADELSYADIAAALDLSMGTVMSRLFNAKRKLRAVMRELE